MPTLFVNFEVYVLGSKAITNFNITFTRDAPGQDSHVTIKPSQFPGGLESGDSYESDGRTLALLRTIVQFWNGSTAIKVLVY
jgi:hypothetical protein